METLLDRLQMEESEHTFHVRSVANGTKEISGDALFAGQRKLLSSILGGGNTSNQARAQYLAIKEWSFVCIKAISQRAAGQPINVGILSGSENVVDERDARRFEKSLPISLRKDATQIEVVETHPILDSIERPNRAMTKWQLIYNLVASLLATGRAYWLILPREDGTEGFSIWPLPSHWVTPIHKDGLFSAYSVMPEGSLKREIIPGDSIAYFSFPDPSDPLKSTSVMSTQARALKVDEQIQRSQEKIFENGIQPQVILRAGRLPGMEAGEKGARPTLTMNQRKQLMGVIARLYKDTTNAGAPMIIDGVIEGIEKFSQSAQEMDFINSGKTVKERIFQAFGVPPFIVGEKQAGSYAMASVVVQSFYDNVVNPLLDMISQAMTGWLGPMFDPGMKTVIWIEPAIAEDREWDRKVWDKARERGDVTDEEFRCEILGLPPNDALARQNRKPKIFDNPQFMTAINLMTQQVSAGELDAQSAAMTLSSFAEFTVDEALQLLTGKVGDFTPHLLLEGPDKGVGVRGRYRVRPKPRRRFTRADAMNLFIKQLDKTEKRMAERATKFVQLQFDSAEKNLRQMSKQGAKAGAALGITGHIFNPRDWDIPLEKAMRPVLFEAMAVGAFSELATFGAKLKRIQQAITKARVVGIPEIEAIQTRMDMPDWMADRLNDELDIQFEQDYWPAINDTTGGQINDIIRQGTVGGQTIAQMASAMAATSPGMSKDRGTMIARTESTGSQNAGHAAAMDALSDTGLVTGKRWSSVLGNTTRDTHRAAHNQVVTGTKDAIALFTVGAVKTPYPGHWSMPAKERVNCQCTILSETVVDDLEARILAGDEGAVEQLQARIESIISGNLIATENF